MPRSIWKGVISFGMVSIPVKLYGATENKDVSFHQLHQECGSRLRQLRWCPACEREVEWGEVTRGYEYGSDQHIVLNEGDFSKLPLPSKSAIELAAFVKAAEIDPVYYERSYYLEPEATGAKPFALLMRALGERKLTAVAKIAIRNKESLCALRPYNGTLMLETLFYPDEIRMQNAEETSDVKVTQKELQMAFSLIDLMTAKFDPEQFHDEYREALTKMIEAKLEGVEIVEAPVAPKGKVVDLMAALKASVQAAKGRKATKAAKREEPAAPARARRRKAV